MSRFLHIYVVFRNQLIQTLMTSIFSRYLLNANYVIGTTLDSGDSAVSKGPHGVYILIRRER